MNRMCNNWLSDLHGILHLQFIVQYTFACTAEVIYTGIFIIGHEDFLKIEISKVCLSILSMRNI